MDFRLQTGSKTVVRGLPSSIPTFELPQMVTGFAKSLGIATPAYTTVPPFPTGLRIYGQSVIVVFNEEKDANEFVDRFRLGIQDGRLLKYLNEQNVNVTEVLASVEMAPYQKIDYNIKKLGKSSENVDMKSELYGFENMIENAEDENRIKSKIIKTISVSRVNKERKELQDLDFKEDLDKLRKKIVGLDIVDWTEEGIKKHVDKDNVVNSKNDENTKKKRRRKRENKDKPIEKESSNKNNVTKSKKDKKKDNKNKLPKKSNEDSKLSVKDDNDTQINKSNDKNEIITDLGNVKSNKKSEKKADKNKSEKKLDKESKTKSEKKADKELKVKSEKKPKDTSEKKPKDTSEKKPKDASTKKPKDASTKKPKDASTKKSKDASTKKPKEIAKDKSSVESKINIKSKSKNNEVNIEPQSSKQDNKNNNIIPDSTPKKIKIKKKVLT